MLIAVIDDAGRIAGPFEANDKSLEALSESELKAKGIYKCIIKNPTGVRFIYPLSRRGDLVIAHKRAACTDERLLTAKEEVESLNSDFEADIKSALTASPIATALTDISNSIKDMCEECERINKPSDLPIPKGMVI